MSDRVVWILGLMLLLLVGAVALAIAIGVPTLLGGAVLHVLAPEEEHGEPKAFVVGALTIAGSLLMPAQPPALH